MSGSPWRLGGTQNPPAGKGSLEGSAVKSEGLTREAVSKLEISCAAVDNRVSLGRSRSASGGMGAHFASWVLAGGVSRP